MFSQAKVVLSEDLSKRGYVTFYIDRKRYREYNGSKINVDLNPNLYKSYKERLKCFNQLAFEFTKAVERGWLPEELTLEREKKHPTFKKAITEILREKLDSNLSIVYKRDLNQVCNSILDYLGENLINTDISKIREIDIESFLNQYKSSGTYYMSKRKTTNVFFSELVRKKLLVENPVKETRPMKRIPKLHQVYDKEQLKAVLAFLEKDYPNLHFCCILTYGCFLRPHQEIRLLKKKHVNDEITKIILSASENKSRRVRTSIVPGFAQEVLKRRLEGIINPETNLLSEKTFPYNESYINTQWARAKKRMLELDLLEKGHTIYSFRHTSAVNVYRKTKDIHVLQQLLQHSNMIVTVNYLRGLGEINTDQLMDALPEL
ncbi:tyrosine-type recombinase/integrase [Pedobacter arcticus]|uniref:tyrosine-type recombinase/integrase n=1 Tax=Pedobacter arcticus TaxID=752140 RepID=UPI000305C928|nr:tyrosine-type recombinase/integrase [Pedobacter arcticus]